MFASSFAPSLVGSLFLVILCGLTVVASSSVNNNHQKDEKNNAIIDPEFTQKVQSVFEQHGFVILRNVMDQDLLNEWKDFTDQFFDDIFLQLHENGHTCFPGHLGTLDTGDKVYSMRFQGYQEIMMRNPGRYEISLTHDAVVERKRPRPDMTPIQNKLLQFVPQLLHTDDLQNINSLYTLLTSTPGAHEQKLHADGVHANFDQHMPCHALSVFVPLVNITADMGPTVLYPGSHFTTRAPHTQWPTPTNGVTPLLNVGDALIFDFRLMHHGMANKSRKNRPFLNFMFHQDWFVDDKNWPERSMTTVRGGDDALICDLSDPSRRYV